VEKANNFKLTGVYRNGYGNVPKLVMHDPELSVESKAIYAYLCSLAGNKNTTYPYRTTILRHLGITKNTYYRHYKPLIDMGYISAERTADKASANIYTLLPAPKKLENKPKNNVNDCGWGIIPKLIMTDSSLSIKAKGLYAYLCAYSGNKDYASPKKSDILFHLNISEPTYYKALNQLKNAGYLEISQRKESGRFTSNVFRGFKKGLVNESSAAQEIGQTNSLSVKNINTSSFPTGFIISKSQSTPVNNTILNSTTKKLVCSKNKFITKNWDMVFEDIKNNDAYINNNDLKNSFSNNNQSQTDDQKEILQNFTQKLLDNLLLNEASTPKSLKAKVALLAIQDKGGGTAAIKQIHKDFTEHIERGLKGRRVRNLTAYCRSALYNWLEERPLRNRLTGDTDCVNNPASYDMNVINTLLDAGKL